MQISVIVMTRVLRVYGPLKTSFAHGDFTPKHRVLADLCRAWASILGSQIDSPNRTSSTLLLNPSSTRQSTPTKHGNHPSPSVCGCLSASGAVFEALRLGSGACAEDRARSLRSESLTPPPCAVLRCFGQLANREVLHHRLRTKPSRFWIRSKSRSTQGLSERAATSTHCWRSTSQQVRVRSQSSIWENGSGPWGTELLGGCPDMT